MSIIGSSINSVLSSVVSSVNGKTLGLPVITSIPPIFQLKPDCTNGWNPVIGQGVATFTRASSTNFAAVCADDLGGFPVGTIRTAEIDEPIIELEGGLLEDATTNRITYSTDFSHSYWAKANVNTTTSAIVSPDGGYNATKVSKVGTQAYLVKASVAVTGASKSIYARTVSGTGSASLLKHNSYAETLFDLTEEWQRFDVPVVDASETYESHFYAVDFRGAGTLTEVLIWQADLSVPPWPEPKHRFASSPIYTVGSETLRDMTRLSYDAAGNFTPNIFSIECEFSLLGLSADVQHIYTLADTSNASDIQLKVEPTGQLILFSRAQYFGVPLQTPIGFIAPHTIYKVLVVRDETGMLKLVIDGVEIMALMTDKEMKNIANLYVGTSRWAAQSMSGHIKSLKIYDYDITIPDVFYISSLFKNGEDGAWFNMSKD